MKKIKVTLISFLILFTLCLIPSIKADTSLVYYEGTTPSGIFVSGSDSAINVEGEELVFNLENDTN